jgi:hypothetical protein
MRPARKTTNHMTSYHFSSQAEKQHGLYAFTSTRYVRKHAFASICAYLENATGSSAYHINLKKREPNQPWYASRYEIEYAREKYDENMRVTFYIADQQLAQAFVNAFADRDLWEAVRDYNAARYAAKREMLKALEKTQQAIALKFNAPKQLTVKDSTQKTIAFPTAQAA